MTWTVYCEGLISTSWFVVLLAAPGLLILGAVVVSFLFYRPKSGRRGGAGYYHILGFDAQTNAPRDVTLHADSEAGARGRAQMDGIVVTELRVVEEDDEGVKG